LLVARRRRSGAPDADTAPLPRSLAARWPVATALRVALCLALCLGPRRNIARPLSRRAARCAAPLERVERRAALPPRAAAVDPQRAAAVESRRVAEHAFGRGTAGASHAGGGGAAEERQGRRG